VPQLTRLSAAKARARLKRAGCTAKVKGRGRHVRKQSARPGRRLKLGARVTVTLGL